MSASSCSLDDSDKLLLRWSEDAFSPSREELVQMLETRISEAVICSSLRLLENTQVFLIGKDSTESGVVRSCRPSGGKFIVTILIKSQPPKPPGIDPSVLLVDNFITEEQEQGILDEIESEIQRQQFRSRIGVRYRLGITRCDGTAAFNRLVKFTVRSSTTLVPNSIVQFWSRFRHLAGTAAFAGTPSIAGAVQASATTLPSPECPVCVSERIQ